MFFEVDPQELYRAGGRVVHLSGDASDAASRGEYALADAGTAARERIVSGAFAGFGAAWSPYLRTVATDVRSLGERYEATAVTAAQADGESAADLQAAVTGSEHTCSKLRRSINH